MAIALPLPTVISWGNAIFRILTDEMLLNFFVDIFCKLKIDQNALNRVSEIGKSNIVQGMWGRGAQGPPAALSPRLLPPPPHR